MSPLVIAIGTALVIGQAVICRRLGRVERACRVLPSLGSVGPTLKQVKAGQDYDHQELGRTVTDLETSVKEAVAEVRMGANSLRHLTDFLVQELPAPNGGSGRPDG